LDIRLLAAVLLCIVWVTAVRAQAGPSAAEKAAMDRAQREADGPRRRIIEAAKVKGTVRAESPAVTPVSAVAAPVAPPQPAPVPRREEPVERSPILATLPAAVEPVALPASAVAAVPLAPAVELAPASASLITMPTTRFITLQPPRLLSKVDPELPARLLRRGARRTEVLVEMIITTDGSVRDISLRNSRDEELETLVREAVLQWRYEPQPVARPHAVKLVFDGV
jgi:TonB family protein